MEKPKKCDGASPFTVRLKIVAEKVARERFWDLISRQKGEIRNIIIVGLRFDYEALVETIESDRGVEELPWKQVRKEVGGGAGESRLRIRGFLSLDFLGLLHFFFLNSWKVDCGARRGLCTTSKTQYIVNKTQIIL